MKINTLDLNSYLLPIWEALQRATANGNTLTLFNSPAYSTDVPFVGAPIVWDGIQNLSYTYDAVGNILTIRDTSATVSGRTEAFTYDDLYRLTTALTTLATSTPYSDTYTYDALGNITNKTGIGAYLYQGTTTGSYANPHAATSINGLTASYDKDGNLTNYASTTNSWDYKNRLTWSYSSSSPSVFYTYDDSMQRMTKRSIGTATTTYPSMYYSTQGATSTITKNIYANGELVATITGSGATTTKEYIHNDYLGSVNAITGSTGTTTKVISYYPYGSDRINTGSSTPQRTFIGQVKDTETSQSYLNARYYEGSRGQFLSEDPVFWEVGQTSDGKKALLNPQSQNSYSYAEDNPIIKKDPTGRCAGPLLPVCLGIIGAGLGIGSNYVGDVLQKQAQGAANPREFTLSLGQVGFSGISGAISLGILPESRVGAGIYGFSSSLLEDYISGTPLDYRKAATIGGAALVTGTVFKGLVGKVPAALVPQSRVGSEILQTSSGILTNNYLNSTPSPSLSYTNKLYATPNNAVIDWNGKVITPAPKK